MANTKISALSADTSVAGTETFLVIDGSTEKKMAASVVRDYINQLQVPAYVSGNFYTAWPFQAFATSSALSANVTYLTPFRIYQSVSIAQLGGRCVAAGTNIQFGLYASNDATGRPTGACLAKTASLGAGANTTVTGNVNSGTPYVASPGIYWFGVAVDNGTTTVVCAASSTPNMTAIYGSATQANVVQTPAFGVSFADTFGTWGSATGASFTELTTALVAVPCFKVS